MAQARPLMQPPILLLKEGTDTSQGRPQLLSNISACLAVVDSVRTTLGPRGMDKLIAQKNGTVTISNDGATVLKLLDVVHPAAKTLVDIARAQDAEVGDGTTSVVLFAGELLREVKSLIEDGVSSQTIITGLRRAASLCLDRIQEEAQTLDSLKGSDKDLREILRKCAATAMSSKLVRPHQDFFTKMVVDAVMSLDLEDSLNESFIGMKKVPGGGMQDSRLIDGVAFKKTFSYAGFEQQPKRFQDPAILMLNVELELKAEKDNAEVRVDSVAEYQAIVDAEWGIIYDKLEKIVATGAKVVLSKLPIGDLATQYFADRDIFCAGRVTSDDMRRTISAVGGSIQSSVNDLRQEHLGGCRLFEEAQIGNERWNLFTGCPKSKTCTLILRGGAEQFTAELERSLHDAIMIVRRALKCKDVVAGGGAIEMELSKHVRECARTIHGKQQAVLTHVARALEVIPRQLCDNAGFDSTDVLNKLRQRHAQPGDGETGRFVGIDMSKEDLRVVPISDNLKNFVWEPSVVKRNMISAATEAACLILSIDETVKNVQSEKPQQGLPGPRGQAMAGMGMGRGRGIPRR